MGLDMGARKAVTKEMARRYERASKRDKGKVLDELCVLTGWSRGHARRALARAADRAWHRPPQEPRPRPRIYTEEVLEPLRRIWATMGGACGKRMAPFVPEMVKAMDRHGELDVSLEARRQLLTVSAATIDRLLAPERARQRVKGRSGTKPGSMLRSQIPIRTFAQWDERSPGFCQVDLVGHDGGSQAGDFAQTLTLTCVHSGWTEVRAMRNKAQRHVFAALQDIRAVLPFPLLGLDSDNGSEFINAELTRYCAAEGITFTRGRPYRKNDSCYVEQKNWSVVRQAVGYGRYDTPAELRILQDLYAVLGELVNFFSPVMKLTEKTRTGARVTRRYDRAATPYQRLEASGILTREQGRAIRRHYLALNPVELRRRLSDLQEELLETGRRKFTPTRKEVRVPPGHPWSRTFSVRQRKASSRTP